MSKNDNYDNYEWTEEELLEYQDGWDTSLYWDGMAYV